MNCKNSAQNALKVAIFRLKIESCYWCEILLSECLSVCLSSRVSHKPQSKFHQIFCTCFISDVAIFVLKRDVKLPLTLYMLPVAMARFSHGSVIRYILTDCADDVMISYNGPNRPESKTTNNLVHFDDSIIYRVSIASHGKNHMALENLLEIMSKLTEMFSYVALECIVLRPMYKDAGKLLRVIVLVWMKSFYRMVMTYPRLVI